MPRVGDDVVTTDEDTATTLPAPGVLRNDGPGNSPRRVTAVNGDTAAVGTAVTLASGATLRVDADGRTSVDPGPSMQFLAAGERLTETVAITVTHTSDASAVSTLTIHIDGLNDAPVIDQDDPVEVDTRSDAVAGDLGLQLTATDVDATDILTWSIDSPAADGTASVDASSGLVDYLPDAGFSGLDEFVVRVYDGQGGSDTITVIIDVALAGPVAVADSLTTDEDSVGVDPAPGVLANDLPGLDGPLSVVALDGDPANVGVTVTLASGAVLTVGADGATTLDPNGAFESLAPGGVHEESVSVTIENMVGVQSTADLDLEITGVNDAPVIDQGPTVAVQTLTTAVAGELGLE
ncbi:MAG: VCBS domain-containing protein, partial [Intrasporangiaceae bacterium]|nr:VCBS domain-containing protein [Intrasporangiaceae bacterium]